MRPCGIVTKSVIAVGADLWIKVLENKMEEVKEIRVMLHQRDSFQGCSSWVWAGAKMRGFDAGGMYT